MPIVNHEVRARCYIKHTTGREPGYLSQYDINNANRTLKAIVDRAIRASIKAVNLEHRIDKIFFDCVVLDKIVNERGVFYVYVQDCLKYYLEQLAHKVGTRIDIAREMSVRVNKVTAGSTMLEHMYRRARNIKNANYGENDPNLRLAICGIERKLRHHDRLLSTYEWLRAMGAQLSSPTENAKKPKAVVKVEQEGAEYIRTINILNAQLNERRAKLIFELENPLAQVSQITLTPADECDDLVESKVDDSASNAAEQRAILIAPEPKRARPAAITTLFDGRELPATSAHEVDTPAPKKTTATIGI